MAEPKFNIQTEGFTTLTPSGGNVTWRTTDALKVKMTIGSATTLYITNLQAGMSGVLHLAVTSSWASLTLSTGKANFGAGRINYIEQGNYLFCFQFDGTAFFWNIAKYSGS